MSELSSMVDLLARRAAEQPNDRAYVFLSEKESEEAELTFAALHRRAVAVAAHLARRLAKGDRALLMLPPGLDFIVAFFGCLIAGVISFIPFVGTLVGATLSIGMAIAQFAPDWVGVGKVAIVFLIGHLLEGNVLSPKLVGDRVGLHPVWIMFALLAGGSLFGFVGVLIAVPVAAVIGVVVRHLIGRYRQSGLYRGGVA